MKGKLIVFEGTDGSGKATQSQLLCQHLAQAGVEHRRIDFPGTATLLQSLPACTSTERWGRSRRM